MSKYRKVTALRNVYTTVLIFFAAAILICSWVFSRRGKNALIKEIRWIMIAAPCTMAAYAMALLMPSEHSARLMYAIYYTLSDWLLLRMMTYTQSYTRVFSEKKAVKYPLYGYMAIDGVLMLLNVMFDDLFIFNCGQMDDGSGTMFYAIAERGALYNFHRVFIYGMAALIVTAYIIKTVKSPAMYRRKYWFTLLSLLVIMAANVLYIVLDWEIDFSVLTYGLMAMAIYYFNVVYVPQGLVEGLLSSSIKNMDDAILCYDIDGNCVYANSVARVLFNVENGTTEKLEHYYEQWLDQKPLADVDDTSWKQNIEYPSGEKFYETQFKRLYDKNNGIVGSFFKIHDETEEVKKLEAERFRATHDRLTGIYNREHFYDKVKEAVSAAPEGTYCMVCSDIKDFKLINDIFGINMGDEILIKISDTIRRFAKEDTIFGRLSGDRFAVCMPKKRFDRELFARGIRDLGHIDGTDSYRVHIHVGVYDIVNKTIEPSVMCDRAYMAIKTIKASFTDTIASYDDGLRESSISEQKVTSGFSAALAEGQFCFYIQPQVAVNGKVLGGEALVRWIHPERGLIPPNEFIGIFERTGLICRLDMNTWELACKKLREWQDNGYADYHLSVNISPKDFYFTDIYKTFTELVERYKIDPSNLRLEITESAIMNDFKKQLVLIQRLREYGFYVEMDDFGSGYSSLNMLKDMVVDTLKVDMEFLRETDHHERSRTILKMVVALSKQLGMEVVTEGVETKEHVDFLTDIGCDIFQGYYFSKPVPVSVFEEKYLTGRVING